MDKEIIRLYSGFNTLGDICRVLGVDLSNCKKFSISKENIHLVATLCKVEIIKMNLLLNELEKKEEKENEEANSL